MLVADQWSRRRKTSEGMAILYDGTGRRKEEGGGGGKAGGGGGGAKQEKESRPGKALLVRRR